MGEWVTSIGVLISAESEGEARASLDRSGIVPGALIGEVLVESIESVEDYN